MSEPATILIADRPFPQGEVYRAWAEQRGVTILDPRCKTEDELAPHVGKADVIIASFLRLTEKSISQARRCRLLMAQGIGYNHIDVEAAKRHGIPVTNNPGWSAEEVAEHTIGLLFASVLQIERASRHLHAGEWPREHLAPIPRIKGRTLGLVAFGRIARNVAERARGLGLRVIAVDPYVDEASMRACGVEKRASLEDLLAQADFVSCHTPLMPETTRLFNEARFRAMKPEAYFINTARGAVMDEAALVRAVEEGWIRGAAVDVYEVEPLPADSPLRRVDNIVLTAHQAGSSIEAYRYGQELIVQEIDRLLSGQPLQNRVA